MPLRGIDKFGFEASETTETLPPKFPGEGGVKVTVKVKCCPGVRSRGGFNPVMVKPVPETVACEMCTFDPPVLVRTWDSC